MSFHDRFSPQTVSDFFAWLAPFYQKARDRNAEYLNHGSTDIDFNTRALFEAMMYFDQRVSELQAQLDEVKQLLGVEANPK